MESRIPVSESDMSFVLPEQVDQFEIKTDYDLSEPIDRNNLCAMIVDSYNRSLGNQEAHRAYFDYLEVNRGFDFPEFMKAFMEAGGCNSLSPQEREFIVTRFKGIKAHKKTQSYNEQSDQENIILKAVDDQLDQLLGHDYFGERERWFSKGELFGMTSEEFLNALKEKRRQVLTNKK